MTWCIGESKGVSHMDVYVNKLLHVWAFSGVHMFAYIGQKCTKPNINAGIDVSAAGCV